MFNRLIKLRNTNFKISKSSRQVRLMSDCNCSKLKKISTELINDVHKFDHLRPTTPITTEEENTVERFKELLRIPTITRDGPNGPNYEMMEYLTRTFTEMDLPYTVHEFVKGYPLFTATFQGSKPELESVLLNSHYDVVPVMEEHWSWPPFEATELDNGDIVARGAQDMKCVVGQYIEAVRHLKNSGFVPERTIYLSFNPDEEVGGACGIAKFIKSDAYKAMNVGVALDEGIASTDSKNTVFYGERTVWWVKLIAKGPTGHASQFIENTAVNNLLAVLQKFIDFRNAQQTKLGGPLHEDSDKSGCKHALAKLGDVTTLNITALKAGVPGVGGEWAYNVIPEESMAGIDMRIPPHVDLAEFEEEMKTWLLPDMEYEFVVKSTVNNPSVTDSSNPHWVRFEEGCKDAGVDLDLQVFPAATDGRYLRNEVGIPVFGFSPLINEPILLHCHNERINKHTYLQGIQTYISILKKLSKK